MYFLAVEGLFRLHSLCVMQCPTHTHQSKHGECVVCNGLCPKGIYSTSEHQLNDFTRYIFTKCVQNVLVVQLPQVIQLIGWSSSTAQLLMGTFMSVYHLFWVFRKLKQQALKHCFLFYYWDYFHTSQWIYIKHS